MRKSILVAALVVVLVGGIVTGFVMAGNDIDLSENFHKPERGCLACHYKYTEYSLYNTSLIYGSYAHKDYVPSGEQGDLDRCVKCHDENVASGEAKPLSGIVHPGHMNSKLFLGDTDPAHHHGNCFSCHDVNGQTGKYRVLYESMDTDFKGVPNSSYYEDMDGMKDWSNGKDNKW